MDGVAGPQVWSALLKAVAAHQHNTHGYTYAIAREGNPETLTVWHDGRRCCTSWLTPGSPVAPTTLGTAPVYLRYHYQIMKGKNPDGSKYADPVHYVSYFRSGEAVHYFPRGRTATRRAWAVSSCLNDASASLAVPDLRQPGHGRPRQPDPASSPRLKPGCAQPSTGRYHARGTAQPQRSPAASIASRHGAIALPVPRTLRPGRSREPDHRAKEPAVPADKLHITLAGSEHVVEEGTTAGQALADRDPRPRPRPGQPRDRPPPGQNHPTSPGPAAPPSPPGSTGSSAISLAASPTATGSSRSSIDSATA